MAKETFVIIWICFAQVYLYILISLFLNVFHSEFIGKLKVCLFIPWEPTRFDFSMRQTTEISMFFVIFINSHTCTSLIKAFLSICVTGAVVFLV